MRWRQVMGESAYSKAHRENERRLTAELLRDMDGRRGGFVHNVIAHPLLWVWPRLGHWLHDRTAS